MEASQKHHPFAATLGPGPYKYLGSCDLGAAKAKGDYSGLPKVERGMGSCSHCGHAIMTVCIIQTGDGKRYGVGSDCVLRVNEGGSTVVDSARLAADMKAAAREKRYIRAQAKIESLQPAYEAALQFLQNWPHPNEYFAKQGKSAADYFRFISKTPKNMLAAIKMYEAGNI